MGTIKKRAEKTQHHNMSDNEGTAAQGLHEDEQPLDGDIEKEINKLDYFLEEADF